MITESDIITKVVSKDIKASEITVDEIMSKDFISISPGSDLNEAAKLMAKNSIRRLPVINEGNLVGILTSSDVLRVSPELTEILVEASWMQDMDGKYSKGPYPVPGICDSCGNFMDDLIGDDGKSSVRIV